MAPFAPLPDRSLDELTLIAAIADELPVGVWVATAPDGAFVYANRAFDEIMGMTPKSDAQAGGYATPYGIYTRDGAPYPEDQMPFARALRAQASVVVDDIAIHRTDGGKVFIRAVARPMFGPAGNVTHVSIAFKDVSDEVRSNVDRAKAEADRQDLLARDAEVRSRAAHVEEQLRHVLAHVPLILFAIDRDGIIRLQEGRGLKDLGWDASDFLGRSIFDLYKDQPAILASTRRALAGEAFTDVVQAGPVVFETSYTPMHDASGAPSGCIGLSADITERRNMQERLVQAERLASMGTLAATVAHEINNPLTYVMANLDVLADQLTVLTAPLSAARLNDTLSLVNDAREGANRVRSIVRGLKAFSRTDDAVGPLDVRVILDRSIAIADNEIKHRARLLRDYGSVPPVEADDVRLSQVFVNLLVNAAQSIPEGQADTHEIRVRTWTEASSGSVAIAIEDTGAGISSEIKSRIFEPFFTTKPVGVGTGLGLSIVYGIVKGFGGDIDVRSELGKGSTFVVRLPAMAREPVAVEPARTSSLNSPRRRLLIVDDDVRVAHALRLLLDLEHDVQVHTHPKEALDLMVGGTRFDLIFCDLMMPEMSGMDLHAALAAQVPEQAERMVFVTGGAFTAAARDFLDRVPNPRLEKPFDIAQLGALLQDRLGTKPA